MKKRMDDLSRGDIQRIVDAKLADGKVTMANRLRAAICAFAHWAYARGHSVQDAGAAVQKAGKETSRRRTPSIEGVCDIWAASFEMGELWGPFLRLAILTCQRNREEVLGMKWAWIVWEKIGSEPIAPWVLHDLRRSMATCLAEAGFDEAVTDRMLNHKATASRPSVVSSVYNKATKLPERARAYNAWADMVTGRWAQVINMANAGFGA